MSCLPHSVRPARFRTASLKPSARRGGIILATAAAAAAAAAAGAATAGGPPSDQWTRSWSPPTGGWALADLSVIGATGEVYTVTRPEEAGGDGGNAIGLVQFDAAGELTWELILGGEPTGSQGLTDLEATAEGVAAIGVRLTEDGPRTLVLDVAVDGSIRWQRLIDGPVSGGFLRPQLAIGPAGERVVAFDDGQGSGTVLWYDADGSTLGSARPSFSGFSGISALEVDADGHALIVGVSDFDRYVVRSLTREGRQLWEYQEQAEGLVLSEAFAAVAPNGDLVVTGTFEVACAPAGLAVRSRIWRLSPEGALVWRNELTEASCGFRVSTGLVVGGDGATYLLSNRAVNAPSELVRLNADGSPAWTRSFTRAGDRTNFRALSVGSAGSILVGGTDFADSTFLGVRALRYAADGTILWTDRVVGAEEGEVFLADVTAGPDRSFAIVGTTRPEVGLERATMIRLKFAACTADLDDDGGVGFGDLLVLLTAWGPQDASPADLDANGTVDFEDLTTLLAAWGPCPVDG